MGIRASDILTCEECKKPTIRRSPSQRYCTPCSSVRDRARKSQFAKDKPQIRTPAQRARTTEMRLRRESLGRDSSDENKAGASWYWDNDPGIVHSTQVAIPFDRRFSKNALWSSNSRGHVYMREEIKAVRDDLIGRFIDTGPWYEGKVWLDIFVEKPDAKSDAVNVIDLVCDSVKKGIGVDDRWFSIRRLDWSIVKTNPQIRVSVGQAVTEHHRCCSYCGRILPLAANFGKNRSMLLGHGRECHDCRKAVR